MAKIQFPAGSSGSRNLPKTRRKLLNCFNNGQGQTLPRFGISQITTHGDVARGAFLWNGSLYQITSTNLRKITNLTTGANSVIGTIAGSGGIRTAIGFSHAVIVSQGQATYTLDSSDTLTDVSGNSNFVAFDDVAHINNRFVYIPSDGDPAKVSAPGAGQTIGATSFFDAEALPDANKACINLKDTLYILGEDSIQLFRDTGATPVPFSRIPGSRIMKGYHGGLLLYGNSFLFIGKEESQSVGIYQVSGGIARKISNEYIDRILLDYTPEELGEAISNRIVWDGYDIATFALRRDSFAFFGGEWFDLDTIINGLSRPWAGGYVANINNEHYTAYSGKIGKLAVVNTDYGERITKQIDFAVEEENRDRFTCQAIEIGLSQGYNSSAKSVALQTSRDNVNYGPFMYRQTAAIGRYGDKLIWNPAGGLGSFDGFMGVRIYTTEDVHFAADTLVARIRT